MGLYALLNRLLVAKLRYTKTYIGGIILVFFYTTLSVLLLIFVFFLAKIPNSKKLIINNQWCLEKKTNKFMYFGLDVDFEGKPNP